MLEGEGSPSVITGSSEVLNVVDGSSSEALVAMTEVSTIEDVVSTGLPTVEEPSFPKSEVTKVVGSGASVATVGRAEAMSEVAAVDAKLEVSSDARDAVDEITSGCAVDVKASELIVTVGSTVVTALTTTVEGENVVVTVSTEPAAVVVLRVVLSGSSATLVCPLLTCDVIGADESSLVALSIGEETVESSAVLVSSVGELASMPLVEAMLVGCTVTMLRVVVVSCGKSLAVARPLLSASSVEVTTAVEDTNPLGSASEVSNVDTVTVDGTGIVTVDGR